MKNILGLSVMLALFLTGCVFIKLPGVEPLTEVVVEGEGRDKIALIDISGIITDEEHGPGFGLSTEPPLTARIKEELKLAEKDERVKGLILRIDSPGGSVTTSDVINHEIRAFKERKKVKVVAELMGVAASGGYYVAASADRIIAHPTTVTGSIGVVAYGVNASGLMSKIGIEDQTIKSGDKKDLGSPLRPMTPEEREILQGLIDSMYERFLKVVSESRGLDRERLRRVADGRVYTAGQALELGLIDSIGYMDDALAEAKELAGLAEARVVTYAPPGSHRDNLYSLAGAAGGAREVNLLKVGLDGLAPRPGISFMYLWMP